MNIHKVEDYLNKEKKTIFDDEVFKELKIIKQRAIDTCDEKQANYIWCLETVCKIQQHYINAYNFIKEKNHSKAWNEYERVEIELDFLHKHLNYDDNKFSLLFIESYTKKLQKLFPYKIFGSRECIIKKEECSICKKNNTIRNRCEHKVGEIYWGEMCYRVVKDLDLLGFALVTNPSDKFAYIQPNDMKYNYVILDFLFEGLNNPFDRWRDTIHIEYPNLSNNKRNTPCDCGSGKKAKQCCAIKPIEHHEFMYLDNPKVKQRPRQIVNTLIGK